MAGARSGVMPAAARCRARLAFAAAAVRSGLVSSRFADFARSSVWRKLMTASYAACQSTVTISLALQWKIYNHGVGSRIVQNSKIASLASSRVLKRVPWTSSFFRIDHRLSIIALS